MSREKLIEEIKKLEKQKFSLEDVNAEIAKRKESPYNKIVDDPDTPIVNRDNAIEKYLSSPQFRRLALEILGGVAGAATGGTFFAARAALRPALGLLYRSLGSGIGEGAAAGAAQVFDPRDDLAKEILKITDFVTSNNKDNNTDYNKDSGIENNSNDTLTLTNIVNSEHKVLTKNDLAEVKDELNKLNSSLIKQEILLKEILLKIK